MNLKGVEANELAGAMVTEVLAVMGIHEVVISPGSRSTPLTYAFANDERLNTTVILDERAAGFFALGKAKANGLPAVLLCTSGTAAANYLPAIVEARYSGTPLLVMTADRPLMDQFCHAGQTILQSGIYRNFVNHEQQLELPSNHPRYLRYLRETLKQAIHHTRFPSSGPVHLNVPFEDPLTPSLTREAYQKLKQAMRERFVSGQVTNPFSESCRLAETTDGSLLSEVLHGVASAICVLGPAYTGVSDPALIQMLEILDRRKIPVLVDVLHPARAWGHKFRCVMTSYEWTLHPAVGAADTLKPDYVFQVGNLPTSKSLRAALVAWDCSRISVNGGPDVDNRDPAFANTLGSLSRGTFTAQLEAIEADVVSPKQQILFDTWSDRDIRAQAAVADACDRLGDSWVEPKLYRELPFVMDQVCDLFIANSMVIRDMENFFATGCAYIRKIYSNRGANGIDGIIATACGSAADGIPLICMLGDLTFLHDASALNLKSALKGHKRILFVLLDNHGGGIFEHLPVASIEHTFESFFATPQEVDVSHLCQAYHVVYQTADDLLGATSVIKDFVSGKSDDTKTKSSEIRVLHLKFDRKRSYQFRRSVVDSLKS